MDYAVTLEFDKETENKIQEMIDEVAKVTGCDYMKQSKIPPHVTVSALVSDNEAALLSEMEHVADAMKKGFIWFANIGVFNPFVIYLGPVMNEFLQSTCRTVNESLLKYADVGNRGRYLPNQWVPHAAIAVKLSPDALKEAFAIVQEKFSAFGATAEKIVLARAEPYEELKSWELKEQQQ
ncbi:MAG: 2'-5' RNA ligase family protein [Lachnospiraceae bacterium]|nr:2'-5' RNA ligase family protein [Lachnospiraceae bacterium]